MVLVTVVTLDLPSPLENLSTHWLVSLWKCKNSKKMRRSPVGPSSFWPCLHSCQIGGRLPACANRRLSNIQLSGGWTSCGLPNLSAFLAACPAGSPSDVQPISGGSGGDWGGWEGKCCFVHWPSSPRHQLHDRRSIRPSTKMRRAAYLAFITTRKIPSVLWPNHRSDCSVLYRCKINKSSPKKNWFLFSLVIFT